MPKFIKLLLKGVPEKGDCIQWRLVIDSIEDLNKYHSLDATLNMEAFMTMEREPDGSGIKLSHIGAAPTRAISLTRYIQCSVLAAPQGTKVYPIIEVAKITDAKYLGMLKTLNLFGAIQLNAAGGYCDLKGFINTWDAEILEEIEKDSFGFPVEDEAIKADTIILENSHPDYKGNYLEREIKKLIPDCGVINTIYNLREVDTAYIIKCLSMCKNICIQTQIQDAAQMESFMQLFCTLKHKKIYLFIDKGNQHKIKSHSLYSKLSSIHSITFI